LAARKPAAQARGWAAKFANQPPLRQWTHSSTSPIVQRAGAMTELIRIADGSNADPVRNRRLSYELYEKKAR
jgi:hypothetical protein